MASILRYKDAARGAGDTNTTFTASAVQAAAGDYLFVVVDCRKTSGDTAASPPTWNGETIPEVFTPVIAFTTADSGTDDEMKRVSFFGKLLTTSATADVTCAVDGFKAGNITAFVCSGVNVTTPLSALFKQQVFDPWSNPSLDVTGVASGDVVLSFLAATNYGGGYSDVSATTWTPVTGQTAVSSLSSDEPRTGKFLSSTKTGTGTVTVGYTPSAAEPKYAHFAVVLKNAVAGATIDTVSSPVAHGLTGRTITTTGLGTLTSMTVGGVSVVSLSATGGDGTWAMPARTDGATLSGYGSKSVVVGDGTDTATSSTVVEPASTQDYVQLTSVNTAAGYLGAYFTLGVGDQIEFDTAATLGVTENYIDVDGGIYTDYSGSQTLWHWKSSNNFVTQITLINGVVADTTPDAFTFNDVTGATPTTPYTSNTITVTGIDAAANISVTGGTYNINGGSYTSSPGTVTNGQTVTTKITSSASSLTAVNSVVTIGGVSDTFTVTTQFVADSTPDAFTFTDVTNQATNSVINSAPITVAGINSSTAISVSGGLYSINGGAYTGTAGTVSNGDLVRAQVTTPWTHSTSTSAIVTIGGVSDTFTATTTTTVDTTPTAFTLNDVTGVAQNSTNDSNTITVTGINAPAAISITGGTYSINGGAFVSSSGNVNYGDFVVVRNIASASLNTTTNAVLTIGGVSDTYSVTTATTAISSNKGQRLGIGIKIGL